MKLLFFFLEGVYFLWQIHVYILNWFSISLGASASLQWDTTAPFLGLFAECHYQVLILNVLWWTVKWEECVKAFCALLRYCSVEAALHPTLGDLCDTRAGYLTFLSLSLSSLKW